MFVFTAAPGSANSDRIRDFDVNLDELTFENGTFTALGGSGSWGADDSRFHAEDGATSGEDSGDRLIYDTSAGNLYYDEDGAGGGSGLIVATLDSAPTITSSDITVI
jgi:Ca2+-binding RTX toxin-like protein